MDAELVSMSQLVGIVLQKTWQHIDVSIPVSILLAIRPESGCWVVLSEIRQSKEGQSSVILLRHTGGVPAANLIETEEGSCSELGMDMEIWCSPEIVSDTQEMRILNIFS